MPVQRIPLGAARVSVKIEQPYGFSYITWGAEMSASPVDILSAYETVSYAIPDIAQDMSAAYAALSVAFTFQPDGEYGTVELPFEDPISGGQGSEVSAPQSAYLYKKFTTSIGRGTSGRFYLPGCNEENVDASGAVEPSFFTAAQNHATTFVDKLSTGDPDGLEFPLPMVLFSTTVDPDGPTSLPVAGLALEPIVATQRRRLKRNR